jgi:hypothetical protein
LESSIADNTLVQEASYYDIGDEPSQLIHLEELNEVNEVNEETKKYRIFGQGELNCTQRYILFFSNKCMLLFMLLIVYNILIV